MDPETASDPSDTAPSTSPEVHASASSSNAPDSRPSTSSRVSAPPQRKAPKKVRFNLNRPEEDPAVSITGPPSSGEADPQIQNSDETPAPTSEGNQDSDQHPDDPLRINGHTVTAQSIPTNESYRPWLGSVASPGILPIFHFFSAPIIFLISFFGCIFVLVKLIYLHGISTPIEQDDVLSVMACLMVYLCIGLLTWALALWAFYYFLTRPFGIGKFNRVGAFAVCVALFAWVPWLHLTLISNYNLECPRLSQWYTMPQSNRRCEARVELQQASLFSDATYKTQFDRVILNDNPGPRYQSSFDHEIYRNVQIDQDLCYQGFAGNTDLYGQGIRSGLYLQWLSSLLANNTLPETRHDIQKVYLVFSLAICLATVISSFFDACIFAIEIEILYWMYWGGFLCVFASAPCPIQLGSKSKWTKLNWTTMVLFTTHALMVYHGIWYIWYAYDQIFSRMPCGTYHFFLVPMLDPSERFPNP